MGFPWWRRVRDEELDEEIRVHLEMDVRERMERGECRKDAERAARREFGNVTLVTEITREMWGWGSLDRFGQDLRFGLRLMRRSPGLTAAAVLSLALGIGANTAMFTVIQSVLLRPLPYHEPDRLVMVYSVGSFGPFSWTDGPFMDPDYLEFRRTGVFSELAAFTTFEASVTGAGDPFHASRSEVTASFFPLLGVRPLLGRVFVEGDDNSQSAVILGDALWRSRFHADAGVIGQDVDLDGVSHTIVGVMPAAFNFPPKTQLWTPLRLRPAYRDNAINRVAGRLAPGVTADQARAAVETVLRHVAPRAPGSPEQPGVRVVDLRESLVGRVRHLLWILLGAVGCVLLVACTNIANLMVARATTRGREMSVRSALGADRGRLVRQLLTESVALATLGGGLGLLAAHLGLPTLLGAVPPDMLPRVEEVRVNVVVMGFTSLLCLLTGLLFGLAPALSCGRREAIQALQHGVGSGTTRGERRVRSGLVVAETALVLVLLVGAGLLLKSLWKLQHVDPGFAQDRILTMTVFLPDRTYPSAAQKRSFSGRLLERLHAVPGIEHASAVNLLPFGLMLWRGDFAVEGRESRPVELVVGKPAVSEDYFRAMNIPLRQGRFFEARDRDGAPLVAIVSESVARACWPGEAPLGRRLLMDDPTRTRWLTVVGVVGDVRQDSLASDPLPMVYVPLRQESRNFFLGSMTFLARVPADATATAAALREQLWATDPELPAQRIAFLDRLLTDSIAQPRFRAGLLLAFAAMALALALVGIYGVLTYEVSRRTAEIGIRRALGARTHDVLWLVIGRTAALIAMGIVVGAASAAAATRALESILFAVGPMDVGTFAAVSLGLAGAAILTSLLAARRVAWVEPAVALRDE